ncbi:hypothetical protein [Photobacterium rosenbergii]|uniref:hypothetical protein n=1 Tax=Photobacterium rosenbergii TaxID=294936 RepID=UPI001C9955DF|nr:hypothetical protein [Photobacterium rosenbergii]MBY5948275.1 hypothetical protein [Photobacterium rosenbergii]
MITTNNLPESYSPLDELEICTNRIVGGGHLVSMGNVLPILIGSGRKPKVWLQAVNNPHQHSFITIVDESKSLHPFVDINIKRKNLDLYIKDQHVLSVEYSTRSRAKITHIDLRPLGIIIYSSGDNLQAGNMSFSNTTFKGVNSVINFSMG